MNLDFYINLGFSVVIGLLKNTIPNDANSKNKYKKAFVKIVRLLGEAYPGDADFQNALAGK
jgi:hypothetical protein